MGQHQIEQPTVASGGGGLRVFGDTMIAVADPNTHTETQVMQCMEVWGGNALIDTCVSISGLDAWVYSKPFENGEAGGDVHYVSSCATGRITRLLLADVSGHGEKVRNTAATLRD